mmetsp:Transcript_90132/g.188456  ORF Transcript_90132/g.188456 Transcript_90132/m.188456 type:complete len:681 (+) Transcript_90132:1054-3096(+)
MDDVDIEDAVVVEAASSDSRIDRHNSPKVAVNEHFPVGSSVSTVTEAMMRVGEDLDTPEVGRLAPDTICTVLQLGIGPLGRRLKVRCNATSKEGWISCVGKGGNVLLKNLTPPDLGSQMPAVSQDALSSAPVATPPTARGGAWLAAGVTAALNRVLATVRASVRLQQAVTMKDRLCWRCQAAKRARLLTPEQSAELEKRIRGGLDGQADEVRDILDGLGVPPAPDEPMQAGSPQWTCVVCHTQQRTRGWRCPFRHRFCRACMVKWTEAVPLPNCPQEGCGYRLGEHDLEDLRVPKSRIEAFRTVRLEEGLAALQEEDSESQVKVLRCPGASCGAAVVCGEARRRWACACGAPPACSACGVTPYHYHGRCSEVQNLRARWLAWLQGGREAYKGLERRAVREATAQQKALKEALDRNAEAEQDEEWKAAHCRLCPKCKRPVEKVAGCNTMVCGQNTHGGGRQAGCGHRFNWKEAKPYKAGPAAARPSAAAARQSLARKGALSGRGVRHLFAQCKLCGVADKCIVGPRFRCIHCQDFSCCMKCEPRLASEHPEGHVFEILFEDELDWSTIGVPLPNGIRARVRRRASHLAPDSMAAMVDEEEISGSRGRKRGRTDDIAGLEGVLRGQRRGRYVLELPDGVGNKLISPELLQPLLTQKQAERLLASGAIANADAMAAAAAAVSA